MKTITKQKASELEQFLDVIHCLVPDDVLQEHGTSHAIRLCEIASSLHHYYELCCNCEPTARQNTRALHLEQEVNDIAKLYGLTIKINYDPRGLPLRIVNDQYHNAWDNTYCIPML